MKFPLVGPMTVDELIAVYDAAMGHCAPETVADAIIHLGVFLDRLDGKSDVYARIAREKLT